MKTRKLLAPVLSAALLITAFPGGINSAKADDQSGNVQEILLVKSQEEEGTLHEVFRTHALEGEKSEPLNQEVLKELKKTSDTAVLIIGKETEENKVEDKQENTPISESQQQIIAQVAEAFEQVVVVFNNYRPYGLEIMDDYASIKTVTMIDTQEEEEMLEAAGMLCQIVSTAKDADEELNTGDTAEPDGETTGQTGEQESEQVLPEQDESDTRQTETDESETKQTETDESETKQTESNQADTGQSEVKQSESSQPESKDMLDKQTETMPSETLSSETTASTEKEKTDSPKGKKDGKRKLGDVNGDGVINTLDATALMQEDKKKVTEELLAYGDVNGDKKINNKDVTLILKYASNEIKEFKDKK